jgi:hypothetical protein
MIEIEQPPGSIAIADAMFDINIDDAAIIITSSFFIIYQSSLVSRYIHQPLISRYQSIPGRISSCGAKNDRKMISPVSIAIADAKFGINVGIAAISRTSSFFFIWYFLYKLSE